MGRFSTRWGLADMNNTTGCEQAIILAKNQRVSAKKNKRADGRTDGADRRVPLLNSSLH
jgi:hypothetical protein